MVFHSGALASAQENWRFCRTCHVMFFDGYSGGKCEAGGTHSAQGLIFSLSYGGIAGDSFQSNWRFCKKCSTLFFNGYGGGRCPAGENHSAQGITFVLHHRNITEDTPGQEGALAIADSLEKGGPGVWPRIDPKELAQSLRERIRVPSMVYQGMMPHCAPAALAVDVARNNPRLYAEIIRGLYTTGSAHVPGREIDGGTLSASPRLSNVDYNQFFGIRSKTSRHPEADWILLSSIRNSESWFNIYWGTATKLGWVSGMTLPSTFEKWLRGVGYTQTVNVTNLVATKGIPELRDASKLYEDGWRVFLFLNGDVLKSATQTNTSVLPNHYVALMTKVTFKSVVNTGGFLSLEAMLSDEYVSFVCATWGRQQRIPADEAVPLKGLDFCKNFYGYVAAVNYSQGNHRQAQCGGRQCLGRSECAFAPGRGGHGDVSARAADARSAPRTANGRDREMVADHQRGRDQG
jgi:hypothetical protein